MKLQGVNIYLLPQMFSSLVRNYFLQSLIFIGPFYSLAQKFRMLPIVQ